MAACQVRGAQWLRYAYLEIYLAAGCVECVGTGPQVLKPTLQHRIVGWCSSLLALITL